VDGSAQVETFRIAGPDGDLPLLFERLRAEAPGRRVTYRVLRPDFLVVAGEDARGPFYTRAARAEPGVLRGYTLSYARGLAPTFEIYAVAISNGFEPSPAAGAAAPAGTAAPASPAAPAAPRLVEASAAMVAPGRLVSALPASCAQPRIGERPARIVRRDPGGLTLLEVPGLSAPALAPGRPAAAGAAAIALFATNGERGGTTISAASGEILAPAAQGQPFRVSASLQDGVAGAAVFDRSGDWIGLVLAPAAERRRVAGVLPGAAYGFARADAVAAFLSAGGVTPATRAPGADARSAGEIASASARSLFGVVCAP
jgi:hypothetical protein